MKVRPHGNHKDGGRRVDSGETLNACIGNGHKIVNVASDIM